MRGRERETDRETEVGREGGWVQDGNNRRGYCKIYCLSSFRLVVMLDEESTIREAGRAGDSHVFNECTLLSFLSLPLERSLLSV